MSKNLCPENNISFDNSQQIKFDTPIPAGTYTASAIVESTDTDSSVCLMLFYYADGSTKEVYISRSVFGERVNKTFELAQKTTRVRIYASEGYSLSVGDTGTFSQLQIEAGDQMTDYVPYGEEEESPEPEDVDTIEVIAYYMALADQVPMSELHTPTCRETMLLRKLLDSSYEVPFVTPQSRVEKYLMDILNGTTEMLTNIPKSDKEKYLHIAIGGTVDQMPSRVCALNYWMSKWLEKLGKV